MAKLFLALSIASLLGAAGLGIATKGKVERKVRELAATQVDLRTSQATLATTSKNLEATTGHLATARQELEGKTAEAAKLEAGLKVVQAEAANLEGTVKSRDERIAKLDTDLADANVKLATEAKNKTMIDSLQAQLVEEKGRVAEQKAMAEQYKARVNHAEEAVVAAQGRVKFDHWRTDPAGTTGSVLSVDSGLNFAVLSVGDRQGLTVNTPVLVVRDGKRIATLKITTVEPRTSIADVVPGTMARGQTLQPGDRVIVAGSRGEQKIPVSAPAPVPVQVPSSGDRVPATRPSPARSLATLPVA